MTAGDSSPPDRISAGSTTSDGLCASIAVSAAPKHELVAGNLVQSMAQSKSVSALSRLWATRIDL
jgi:hypothetical protein